MHLCSSDNILCVNPSLPKKKIMIFLYFVRIRSISKRNLDVHELKKCAKILVEVIEYIIGFQRNGEDYYFYFLPTKQPSFVTLHIFT